MTRIIAGLWRGRALTVPRGSVTRPTNGKVRAALGNSLSSAGGLDGATVLDLFAGTGALGLELASRGAARVVLVDNDRAALAAARANVAALGAGSVQVVAGSAASYAASPGVAFDVVVADPPYDLANDDLTALLRDLVGNDRLRAGADVILERSRRTADLDWPAPLVQERSKRYGDTVLLFGRAPDGAVGPVTGPACYGAAMTHAVCPGSFDPPTLGHLDIVGRTAGLFDRVTVAVLVNPDKKGLFSVEERLDLLRSTTGEWPNVTVDSFQGLLVDYCRDHRISVIVKGIRAVSDYDYELQMAQMNKGLTGVDTFFLPTNPEFSFLSSSLVKQVAALGGDVSHLLPEPVRVALAARL